MFPIYRIIVAEELSSDWSDWFDGLTITRLCNGMTMLTGSILDSSALYGILAKARDLNLTLLAVNRLDLTNAVSYPNGGI